MAAAPNVRGKLRLNARGAMYLLLTLTIGIAAASKGNNLLFVIFSALLGLLAASLILTLATSRVLRVTRIVPESVFAGDLFQVTLRFHNPGKFWPAFALRFDDRLTHEGRPAQIQPPPVYLPLAGPGGRVRTAYEISAFARGWAKLGPLTVVAEFPPGLFTYQVTLPVEDSILVYPRPGVITRRVVNPYLARMDYEDVAPVLYSTGDEEFAGLRDFRPGDPPRRIHWKMSARLPGRLLIREFEDARVRDAVILLETHAPNPADGRRRMRFERAVSFAGALAEALLQDNYRVTFRAFGPERVELTMEPGAGSVHELYGALALIGLSRTTPIEELLPTEETAGRVFFVLCIGDKPRLEGPAAARSMIFGPADMRRLMHFPV